MNKLLQYGALAAFVGTGMGAAHAADAPSTSLGGKLFIDMSHISSTTDGKDNSNKGVGFDAKRFYFSVTHRFDDIWSVNLTTDFHYSSSDGKSDIFVKKAFVEGNFAPLFKLRVGSADMPWIPYVEDLYGFRYVENTVTDRFGLANSADWGLHALGKEGIFDYQASIVSGAGYSHVNARSKQVDYNLRAGIHPFDGLTAALGFYDGKRGEDVATATTPINTQTMYNALVAYNAHGLRLGGEYFSQRNPKGTGSSNLSALADAPKDAISGAKDRANGYSFWGSYEVYQPITLFARYDEAKLSRDLVPSLKNTYFNVGAQYAVRKGIDVALVYKYEKMKDDLHSSRFNEVGLFGQVAF